MRRRGTQPSGRPTKVYDQVREAVVEIRAAIAAATARARAPVIAVIRKGSDFGHATKYLFGPGERGEHVDAHVMAGGSVPLGDRRGWDWIADMRFC
jgi:hypothetical protein